MDSPLFTFGIITDTHIRPPEGDASSPYEVNKLANARARYAVELLEAQKPDFTIHLGDMVHTLPHMPSYDQACEEALDIFTPLKPNLHFVAGNHDIGDKPMPASPAAGVNDAAQQRYESHFGHSWYVFEQLDCAFIIINSSLINSGTSAELEQKQWLLQTLESLKANENEKRIFLFSHYPPFIHEPTEGEHYDNLSQPGRQWLLDLIEQYEVSTILSGHVHHFFHNCTEKSTFFCLPPTSFIRQDFAELFKVGPAEEYGRDDVGKYSVAIIEVYSDSYKLRIIPTSGREWSEDDTAVIPKWRAPERKDLVVHLRHAWYEAIELPYNGPMEEFTRKKAHNDYTLLRLLQMGVRNVRVPVSDLCNEQSRIRMQAYARAGIHFHLFQLAPVSAESIEMFKQYRELVASVEIVCDSSELAPEFLEHLKVYSEPDLDLDIYISKVHSSATTSDDGKPFAHSVSNGYSWEEREHILQNINSRKPGQRVTGVVFEVPLENDITITLNEMGEAFAKSNLTCIANIRLAPSNPAVANFDDSLILKRVSEALECTRSLNNVVIQFDTFADIDRGFAPRHGFVDRRFNLRPVGRMLMRWERRA